LTEHAFKVLPYRGVGSGIPRALEQWPQIELIDDERGNQFSAVIQRPAAEWAASVATGSVTDQVTDPVSDPVTAPVTAPVDQLLLVLRDGPLPPSAIQKALGLKHRPTFRANYLYRALESGLIEMTIPDTPSSRLQKYRLTAKGQALLRAHVKD
jgi:hypothetical protein